MTLSVVVATVKLEDIPLQVGMVAGGFEHLMQIRLVNWFEDPIYTEDEFPVVPKKYNKPMCPSKEREAGPSNTSRTYRQQDEEDNEEFDKIYMSRKVLIDLCRYVDLDLISMVLREVITGNHLRQTIWNLKEDSETASHNVTPNQK